MISSRYYVKWPGFFNQNIRAQIEMNGTDIPVNITIRSYDNNALPEPEIYDMMSASVECVDYESGDNLDSLFDMSWTNETHLPNIGDTLTCKLGHQSVLVKREYRCDTSKIVLHLRSVDEDVSNHELAHMLLQLKRVKELLPDDSKRS